MPMNMERSPRDIAGGYLLLMLAQGDSKDRSSTATTINKSNLTNHNNSSSSNSISHNIIKQSQASNWNPYYESRTMIHNHPHLGLYVANAAAAFQDSILSLTTRHHQPHSYYWNQAEIDKSRSTPPSMTVPHHHSPYKVVHDNQSFESSLSKFDTKPVLIPLNNNNNNKAVQQEVDTLSPHHHRPSVEVKKSPLQCSLSTPPQQEDSSLLPVPTTPTSDKIPLPLWFTNSTTTVVIGKGHLPRKTPGNHLLRRLVKEHLQAYQESNRRGRATIVSTIYQTIRSMNGNEGGKTFGNFSAKGEWQEAKEHAARDKIAATFRDCLCDFYKSSTKSKVAKRRIRKATETHPTTTSKSTTTTTTTTSRLHLR